MPTLQQKTACLTHNSFKVSKALHHLYGPLLKPSRQFTYSYPLWNELGQHTSLSHDDPVTIIGNGASETKNETDPQIADFTTTRTAPESETTPILPKKQAMSLLSKALRDLRRRNRDALVRKFRVKGTHDAGKNGDAVMGKMPLSISPTGLRRLKESPKQRLRAPHGNTTQAQTEIEKLSYFKRIELPGYVRHVRLAPKHTQPFERQEKVTTQLMGRDKPPSRPAQFIMKSWPLPGEKVLKLLDASGSPLPEPQWVSSQDLPTALRTRPRRRTIESTFVTPMWSFRNGEQSFDYLTFDPQSYPDYFAFSMKDEQEGLKTLDYRGRVVLPSAENTANLDFGSSPWMDDVDKTVETDRLVLPSSLDRPDLFGIRFAQELLALYERITPTPLEIAARDAARLAVQHQVLKSGNGRFACQTFGSELNKTALATSDLDFRVYFRGFSHSLVPPPKPVCDTQGRFLQTLFRTFKAHSLFDEVEILHARYPLVAMRHIPSQIRVQIVTSNSTHRQREIVKNYIHKQPHLRIIHGIVKAMLETRKLTSVFHGGIGSYPLLMMVVASLRLQPSQSLTINFLNFLDYWAHFDSTSKALSLGRSAVSVIAKTSNPASPVTVDEETSEEMVTLPLGLSILVLRFIRQDWLTSDPLLKATPAMHDLHVTDPKAPFLLCIQDPADPRNDLGRKAFAWKHIQATFEHMANYLRRELAKPAAELPPHHSVLAPLIGPYLGMNAERRKACEEFGRLELEVDNAKRGSMEREIKKIQQRIELSVRNP
jgi:hypothetical protein